MRYLHVQLYLYLVFFINLSIGGVGLLQFKQLQQEEPEFITVLCSTEFLTCLMQNVNIKLVLVSIKK